MNARNDHGHDRPVMIQTMDYQGPGPEDSGQVASMLDGTVLARMDCRIDGDTVPVTQIHGDDLRDHPDDVGGRTRIALPLTDGGYGDFLPLYVMEDGGRHSIPGLVMECAGGNGTIEDTVLATLDADKDGDGFRIRGWISNRDAELDMTGTWTFGCWKAADAKNRIIALYLRNHGGDDHGFIQRMDARFAVSASFGNSPMVMSYKPDEGALAIKAGKCLTRFANDGRIDGGRLPLTVYTRWFRPVEPDADGPARPAGPCDANGRSVRLAGMVHCRNTYPGCANDGGASGMRIAGGFGDAARLSLEGDWDVWVVTGTGDGAMCLSPHRGEGTVFLMPSPDADGNGVVL